MRKSSPELAVALLAAALASGCRTRAADPAGDRAAEGEAASASEQATAAEAATGDSGEPVRIVYPAAPGSFTEVIEEAGASVVHIRSVTPVTGGPAEVVPGDGESHALGSGFVVDSAGHVLTNDHVVARAGQIEVVLADGTRLPARVIGRDAKLDIALLAVDGSPALMRPARLGDSGELRTGEWVVALGNPFGDEITAAAGIVSAQGAGAGDALAGKRVAVGAFLRTDAAIDASNSGGPLVNLAGEVVGVATAVDRRSGRGGFAVPIDRAEQILPMLEESGSVTRAWLGVFVHPVSPGTATRLGLEAPTGALVSDVVAGGPAARAGIEPGDVILRWNGEPVDHRSLPWVAARAGVGRRVTLGVWRSGDLRDLELVAEKMPE